MLCQYIWFYGCSYGIKWSCKDCVNRDEWERRGKCVNPFLSQVLSGSILGIGYELKSRGNKNFLTCPIQKIIQNKTLLEEIMKDYQKVKRFGLNPGLSKNHLLLIDCEIDAMNSYVLEKEREKHDRNRDKRQYKRT